MSLNGCLGPTERGAWRGVGRKGWQRLAKGWRRVQLGEGLADFLAPSNFGISEAPASSISFSFFCCFFYFKAKEGRETKKEEGKAERKKGRKEERKDREKKKEINLFFVVWGSWRFFGPNPVKKPGKNTIKQVFFVGQTTTKQPQQLQTTKTTRIW